MQHLGIMRVNAKCEISFSFYVESIMTVRTFLATRSGSFVLIYEDTKGNATLRGEKYMYLIVKNYAQSFVFRWVSNMLLNK